MSILAGSTDVSLYVYFVDDDGGTAPGEPTTGLLFSDIETGGSASYMRQGGLRTDFTLITLASADAAHADGGFILVDDTNMPGLYRVDVPDAAFAAGVEFAIVQLVAAAAKNTLMRPLMVELTAISLAAINAEMADVMKTDTLGELSQGIPPANPTFEEAAMLQYMKTRNKLDVDASNKKIYNDAGVVITKKALTDDGTTYSEAEMISGP